LWFRFHDRTMPTEMGYEVVEFSQPMYGGVNVLRIGDTLVDTGHVAPMCRDDVAAALEGPLAGVERVLHTHPHVDHVGGSQTVDALADLPHVVPVGHTDLIHDYADYLRRARGEMSRLLGGFETDESMWDVYFPIEEYAEERIDVVRTLADGDRVHLGGHDLEVVSTPGHADPHVALWHADGGTLFSGDLVDRDGRFQYGPLLGDVGEYKQSLQRVRDLDPGVLVPMHGPPMEAPERRIEASLENARETETRIQRFVSEEGPCHAREFVADELGVEGTRAPFLTLVVYEYARHLADCGLLDLEVTVDGIRLT